MLKKSLKLLFFVLVLGLSNVSAQTDRKIKTISKGVVNGSAISLPKPVYPAAARAVGASGAVNVQILIDEIGNVISANAVSGHPLLRQASEQAALQAKFKPVFLQGTAVRVNGVIVYNFIGPPKLDEDSEEEFTSDKTLDSDGISIRYKGDNITHGAITLVKPEYPAAAKAVGASGRVEVKLTIDEEGNVVSAEAISGHPLLRAAAVNAALLSKFKPALLSGNPIKVNGVVAYYFIPPVSENQSDNSASDEKSVTALPSSKILPKGVVNGKAISLPRPAYPAEARSEKAGGAVNVQVIIDEEGNVASAKAVSGHELLRNAAEQAALGAKFSPTLLEGIPVKVTGVIVYNFVP
ncbi:MAG: energy transducer TonB [Pyrinomonadaceae bacterium]